MQRRIANACSRSSRVSTKKSRSSTSSTSRTKEHKVHAAVYSPSITKIGSTSTSTASIASSRLTVPITPFISRYKYEFEELGKLGSGGFGSVYRVRNKIDGSEYAIKKIRFHVPRPQATAISYPTSLSSSLSTDIEIPEDSEESKLLQEARTMAKLCRHRHLVRYYQAWLEIEDDHVSPSVPYDDEERSVTITTTGRQLAQELSDSFSYEIDQRTKSSLHSKRPTDDIATSFAFPHTYDTTLSQSYTKLSQTTSDMGFDVTVEEEYDLQSNAKDKIEVVLYIQMQLCNHATLRDWLWREGRTIDANENRSLFLQIVKGVAHIHRKKFVHFDLKPSNIFLKQRKEKMVVKIGDLGLAREVHELESSSGDQHGSLLYMSPERLFDTAPINEKSDIFALGIILFEMHVVFSTESERIAVLTALGRESKIPPEFAAQWPFEASLIRRMVSHNPDDRPTAQELLKIISAKVDTQMQLVDTKKSLELSPSAIRHQIAILQKEIERLSLLSASTDTSEAAEAVM